MTETDLRAYDPERDREELWAMKRAFELELGVSGGEEKAAKYEEKLDSRYRERYLEWVDRCVEDEDCVLVVEGEADGLDSEADGLDSEAHSLDGYFFMLPERMAFIWDAAVLNELYVRPDRRGTGLVDEMMDRIAEHARGQDLPLDRLVFDVDRDNERARAVYDRHGFTHWAEMLGRDI